MKWLIIVLVIVLTVIVYKTMQKRLPDSGGIAINGPAVDETSIAAALEMENAQSTVIAIDNYLGGRFYTDPSQMTSAELNFMYVEEVEREVNNGGFKQFFYNSSGDHAHEALNALGIIGAGHTAKLLSLAMELFPDNRVPTDRDDRVKVLERIQGDAEAVWHELDDRFFQYEDDISSLLVDYVNANRDEFH
ncbi:MAG: DMP19 family protein [Desulfobacteraceae bacterium]|nr:DMP19 family protein [Desulfobacteraceae bacterium]